MIINSQFEYVDPMGIFEKVEDRTKPRYEPPSNDCNVVREIIHDEQFLNHCRALNGQRQFLVKKRLAESTIIDELWKRLTYK